MLYTCNLTLQAVEPSQGSDTTSHVVGFRKASELTAVSSVKSSSPIRDHQSSIGNKWSSTAVVGFQPASSVLKARSPDTSSITSGRTLSLPGSSMESTEYAPMTDHNDKKCVSIKSSSVTQSSSVTVRHCCSSEKTHPSHYESPQEMMRHGDDVGDSKEHPLVIDDSSSSCIDTSHDHIEESHEHSEASHDHNETSHDHDKASHDHSEASHDHNEASHDHTKASHDHMRSNEHSEASHDVHRNKSERTKTHDTHMNHVHSSSHDKQKVANLVVCILNPYLKKGRIANKVQWEANT